MPVAIGAGLSDIYNYGVTIIRKFDPDLVFSQSFICQTSFGTDNIFPGEQVNIHNAFLFEKKGCTVVLQDSYLNR
jgi:hypothetical protein